MFKVNYIVEEDHPLAGPTKKAPWMTFNGENIGDSQVCIEKVADKFGLDIYQGLSANIDRAVSKAFQAMIEDRMIPMMAIERFGFFKWDDFKDINPSIFPKPMRFMSNFIWKTMGKGLRKANPGFAGLTHEQLAEKSKEYLECLSKFLGNNKFFFGNDCPSLLDTIVFGYTNQLFYMSPESSKIRLKAESFDNLVAHHKNIKETYFADWNELLHKSK